MRIEEQIGADIKDAMRSREKVKLAALRDVKSKFLLELSAAGGDGIGGEISDETALRIIAKLLKQREETIAVCLTQAREDLADEEQAQADVLKAYLPEPLGEDDIRKVVQTVIDETGASSMADMGRVMGMVSSKLTGQADGGTISKIVRSILG
jgi:uncharacterized protein YqeY